MIEFGFTRNRMQNQRIKRDDNNVRSVLSNTKILHRAGHSEEMMTSSIALLECACPHSVAHT
jgi:hypothetical protein